MDYIILSLAILSAGGVVVPVTVSASAEVAQDVLDQTDAAFLISEKPMGLGDEEEIRLGVLPSTGGFYLSLHPVRENIPDELAAMSPAFIRFSSGTTGRSKGVVISHPAIMERTDAANSLLKISSDDVVLWVLSMSYHFVVSILLFLRRGATICLCSEQFPFSFLSVAGRGDGTFIYATPFHYRTLAETKSFAPKLLKQVRMAVSTAMKLPFETRTLFEEKFGIGLSEAYGIIEVGLPFVNASDEKPPESVGRAGPGFEIEIRNPDADGVGEVLLRGSGMYSAYLSPWAARRTGDWFASGDLGRVDENGFLFLLGRSKQVINFAGMKVFPHEVEAVLERFPGVGAAIVFPEVHARYGQLPCARVEGDELDSGELQRFCYQHLESYKVPKKIEVVARLERTGSGKVKRI